MGVASLTTTLNGAGVRLPVTATFGGRHVLNLAELGSVHRGVNHLRVRLIMRDGRVDDVARTFRLDRRRNIAIARLELPAAVGRTDILDARGSLIVHGVSAARGVRWALVGRPRLSHTRLRVLRGGRIALRPDVPGNYLVALRVGTGPQRGYDLLRVSADYPEPLVPLDTIALNGAIGVQVGNQYYKDTYVTQPDGPAEPSPIQVVVLERDNLQMLTNVAYSATSQGFDALGTYLKTLDNTVMVIVTHPNATDPLPSDALPNLDNALHSIGGTLAASWTFSNADCWSGGTEKCVGPGNPTPPSWQRSSFDGGSFSVIGIPGLQVGQAWRETALQGGGQDGRIAGYLTRGTDTDTGGAGYYTVINGGPSHYASVDTCAGSSCAVRVGWHCGHHLGQ